jgi:hypothetical protein
MWAAWSGAEEWRLRHCESGGPQGGGWQRLAAVRQRGSTKQQSAAAKRWLGTQQRSAAVRQQASASHPASAGQCGGSKATTVQQQALPELTRGRKQMNRPGTSSASPPAVLAPPPADQSPLARVAACSPAIRCSVCRWWWCCCCCGCGCGCCGCRRDACCCCCIFWMPMTPLSSTLS